MEKPLYLKSLYILYILYISFFAQNVCLHMQLIEERVKRLIDIEKLLVTVLW